MAVFFWYLVKVTCPVYATVNVYTGLVTFYKVPETHGHVKLVTIHKVITETKETGLHEGGDAKPSKKFY